MEEPEKLSYKMAGSRCLTSCPYMPDVSINSNGCRGCKYYAGTLGLGLMGCNYKSTTTETDYLSLGDYVNSKRKRKEEPYILPEGENPPIETIKNYVSDIDVVHRITDKVKSLILCGLIEDGARHKQYILEQILRLISTPEEFTNEKSKLGWEEGIAP